MYPNATRRSTYVEEVIKMVPIFVIIEATAIFANLAALGVAIWFENISWLEEDLTGVLINLLEPVPQLLVSVGVVVKRIDGVLNLVHVLAIGEPFKKRFQLASGLLEGGILGANVDNGFAKNTIGGEPTFTTSLD